MPRKDLKYACEKGDVEKVKKMLRKSPSLVNESLDSKSFTPLHCASSAGHKNVVEVLLAANANIHAEAKFGLTPLHHASLNGEESVVLVLLAASADIHAKDRYGCTPLHYASFAGHNNVVEVLLAANANINAKNNYEQTPLYKACINGQVNAAKVLLAANANINGKEEEFDYSVDKSKRQQIQAMLKEERDRRNKKQQQASTPSSSPKPSISKSPPSSASSPSPQASTPPSSNSQPPPRSSGSSSSSQTSSLSTLPTAVPSALSTSSSITNVPLVKKRFPETKYKELYEPTEAPKFSFDVFSAVKTFITIYGKQQSIPDADVNRFIGELHQETTVLGGVNELIGEVGTIAIRLWTSAKTLNGRELCSIFNQAIRDDNEVMMSAVVMFARGINLLCVTRDSMSFRMVQNPEKTYRGGALPPQHQSFFEVGKQFRTPQFLSTSKNRRVASNFAFMASERREEPVVWEFVFHPDFGCKHVNFLQKSNVEGEEEFLFTAYSVFTVRSREIKSLPNWMDPHKIVLEVAPDNRLYPEDLPLSPWS